MSSCEDCNEQPTVICVNQLSSDIEAEDDDPRSRDDEINLLSDREIAYSNNSCNQTNLISYKRRYRDLVHALRRLNDELEKHQHQEEELKKQIAALEHKSGCHKRQNSDGISLINVASEGEITNKHNSHRQNVKLRDLEKLMAKCKESLKAKNQQLKILKESLQEVDNFKESINEVKNELKDLRQAHETWTLSIAENKRVMHQEIENKNLEIDRLKCEIKELNTKAILLKTNLQNLESRMVSTSAAHQKERDSLTKELMTAKNNAIKQLQKDHDLQLERVKLDFERSIENLKLELLVKDEQIIRNAEREQNLTEQNCSLKTDLESIKNKLNDALKEIADLRSISSEHAEQSDDPAKQCNAEHSDADQYSDLKMRNAELEKNNKELSQQVDDITGKLSALAITTKELELELTKRPKEVDRQEEKACDRCSELKSELDRNAERTEQLSFELKAKLDLMTTANSDQEKVLQDLKSECQNVLETNKSLRSDYDELSKKNENLSQVIQDNEIEVHNLQEQLKQLAATRKQLDALKRENSSLSTKLAQVNAEMNDRLDDIKKYETMSDDLRKRLASTEHEARCVSQVSDTLKKEKDSLAANLAVESKRRMELEQKLVISILAAMKNLDTPDVSPGSDKTYNSDVTDPKDPNKEGNLPDPVRLAEKLSSLALDKSNAFVTANQRLEAVLLDNSMINEEVKRLKEELNSLNREKTNEVMNSLEEVERLRTENQALIHDQKAYDDQIASLERDIVKLQDKISEMVIAKPTKLDAQTATDDTLIEQLEFKQREIEQLKTFIAEKERNEQHCQPSVSSEEVPDPTEFKYLKNIVLQFMMGREPTTLARVISAVFKFEQEQVEQICRVQDAIHQVAG